MSDTELDHEHEILTAYALRFDGTRAEFHGESADVRFEKLLDAAILNALFPTDLIDQFECFYRLQRFLCKWGGESLPDTSLGWRAFRMLFLMTAAQDVPEQYQFNERYRDWERDFLPERSKHIALVAGIHTRTRYAHAVTDEPTSESFLSLYFLEDYLLGRVRHTFQSFGMLRAFDLFCIIIWKANRAKTKIARALLKRFPGKSLDDIAQHLASSLQASSDDRSRLRVLMDDFGFRLPMASAILTILYPESFTVFDVRSCESLGLSANQIAAAQSGVFATAWDGYRAFCDEVLASHPSLPLLRDKDRALWASSFYTQLNRNLRDEFRNLRTDKTDNADL